MRNWVQKNTYKISLIPYFSDIQEQAESLQQIYQEMNRAQEHIDEQ